MTATYFPSISPTSRSYTPGEYARQEFESLDGTKTYIRYGNKRTSSTLDLTFSNITDLQVVSILSNYESVNEGWTDTESKWVEFIDANSERNKVVTAGVEATTLQDFYIERTELKWRYDGPPTVTSTFPNRSTVQCKFVACLDSP